MPMIEYEKYWMQFIIFFVVYLPCSLDLVFLNNYLSLVLSLLEPQCLPNSAIHQPKILMKQSKPQISILTTPSEPLINKLMNDSKPQTNSSMNVSRTRPNTLNLSYGWCKPNLTTKTKSTPAAMNHWKPTSLTSSNP